MIAVIFIAACVASFRLGDKPKPAYRDEVTNEQFAGLPLDDFDKEIDLSQWRALANFDFDKGLGDAAHKQPPFELFEGAKIADGHLILADARQAGQVTVKQDLKGSPEGLALNFRFLAETYPDISGDEQALVQFSLSDRLGIWLISSRWGNPNPTVHAGSNQRLAPHGVIEPRLIPQRWHDVWIGGKSVR